MIIDISEVLSSTAPFFFLLLTCSVVKMLKLYDMVIISLATAVFSATQVCGFNCRIQAGAGFAGLQEQQWAQRSVSGWVYAFFPSVPAFLAAADIPLHAR